MYEGEAEGEAQAILCVQQAMAESIRLINQAAPEEGYLLLKKLEAVAKMADGKATKLIVPSELQGIAGLAAGIKEITADPRPAPKPATQAQTKEQ